MRWSGRDLRAAVRALPASSYLPRARATIRGDALAALSVWAMLVPQSMAYATLAGVPPVRGLDAAAVGLVAYALLGTSRQLNVGPSSGMAILSAAAIAPLAARNADRFFELTAMLAVVVGALLILAALARLGFIAEFLAHPVLAGYLIGLALLMIVGQLSPLLGLPSDSGTFPQLVWHVLSNLDRVSGATAAVGFASLALILLLNRFLPRAPSALLAVGAGILAGRVLDLRAHGVAELGRIDAALPSVGLPHVGLVDTARLGTAAVGLALLAFAESVAAARTIAVAHDYEIDVNRELFALGIANVGSGLAQGLAIDGSVSRSTAADRAGQRTQLAGLVNVVLVVVTIAFLTPLFARLPKATLAAIVVAGALPLLRTHALRRLRTIDTTDYAIALVCLLGVLALGVLAGIVVAVLASLVALVYRSVRPYVAVLGRSRSREADEDVRWQDVARHRGAQTFDGLVIFRFDQEVFFANATFFRRRVRELVAAGRPRPTTILLDAAAVTHVDTTALDMLAGLQDELAGGGVDLWLARLKSPVRDTLDRAGLLDRFEAGRLYPTISSAVAAYVAAAPPRREPSPQAGDAGARTAGEGGGRPRAGAVGGPPGAAG